MACCVFILHSSGVSCDTTLLSEAAHCASAVFNSLRLCSLDFTPTVAVIRANPVEGVQYAYSSFVVDNQYNYCTEDSAADVAGDRDAIPAVGNTQYKFCGRSAEALQRAILRCGSPYEKSKDSEDFSGVWRCLSGALLSGCCFLHAHAQGCEGSARGVLPAHGGSGSALPRKRVMIVFSDVCSTHPLTFAEECSFSAAAAAGLRLCITTHIFGQAVDNSSLGGHLQAFAHASGGICATRFAFSHVGYVIGGCAGSGSSQGTHGTALTRRQQREALVEKYVVTPANLPQDPTHAGNASEANVSCLAWLCPTCLAVVVRHAHEDEELAKACVYCSGTR